MGLGLVVGSVGMQEGLTADDVDLGMIDPIDIVDDHEQHRFRYDEGGDVAQLVYRAEAGRLTLVHTEVPDALGGRGIAGRLVRAAVARAAASGETIAPSCPYARKWLREHPDAISGITVDWGAPPTA
jgi:predicted GNAT family acetyltransferase